MVRLTEWSDYGVALCGQKCEHNEPISDPCTEHDCHQRLMKRLAVYEDTGLEPSEVAALVARCKAEVTAHIVCYSLSQAVRNVLRGRANMECHCHNCGTTWYAGNDGWIYCPHCRAQNNALIVGRGPQEGATAHERV